MIENIRLSFQGIWSHKMRSFLTMLGIIIGIAAIIAIVSTIKGTNEQIKKNLVGSGNNLVEIKLSQDGYDYEMDYNGVPDGIPVRTEDERQEILKLDTVVSAAFYNYRRDWQNTMYFGEQSLNSAEMYGIDEHYFETVGYQLMSGRFLTADDYANRRSVLLIDDVLAEGLFQQTYPVGQVIEISGNPYTVVGVVTQKNTYEPVINSIEDYYQYAGSGTSGKAFLPITNWPLLYQFDEPQNCVVRAASTDAMTGAGQSAQDIMNRNVNNDAVTYKAADLLQQAAELQQLSASTNQQLLWIASISLLVGGIGVMNIMLVSVTERTREIGLKKAIGARKSRILRQFLTEAAVLTSIGGVIGVLAGIGLAFVISKLTSSPVAIDPGISLLSVLFSMVIGIIFGLLPSVKAANLDPIEALRRE